MAKRLEDRTRLLDAESVEAENQQHLGHPSGNSQILINNLFKITYKCNYIQVRNR